MSHEQYLVAYKKINICADNCATPICDCPWLHAGKPIPGWNAKKSFVRVRSVREETYHIFDCPLRIPQPEERLEERHETESRENDVCHE